MTYAYQEFNILFKADYKLNPKQYDNCAFLKADY